MAYSFMGQRVLHTEDIGNEELDDGLLHVGIEFVVLRENSR